MNRIVTYALIISLRLISVSFGYAFFVGAQRLSDLFPHYYSVGGYVAIIAIGVVAILCLIFAYTFYKASCHIQDKYLD